METNRSLWHGSLKRHNFNGKRKIAVSEQALHKLLYGANTTNATSLQSLIRQTALRKDTDYVYDSHSNLIFTILAVQALLVIGYIERSGSLFNDLSDLIHKNFKEEN